jgi:hypothetical protein
VKVSGVVVYEGWKSGGVRISAFDADHSAHPKTAPHIVGSSDIAAPGPFAMDVPENAGKVYVEAAVDENGDGRPGPLDPQGVADRYPITIGKSGIDGITVVLTKRDPPPGGAGEDF